MKAEKFNNQSEKHLWRQTKNKRLAAILMSCMSFTIGTATIAGSMPDSIAHWPFDKEGILTDVSGNQNDLKTMNNVDRIDGKLGEAIGFSGGKGYALWNYPESGNISAFTVSAWVKLNKGKRNNQILCSNSMKLFIGPDNRVHWDLTTAQGDIGGIRKEIISDKEVDTEKWNFIAGIWDGAGMKLYINGKLQNQEEDIDGEMSIKKNEKFYIGQNSCLSIDELKLDKKALNEEELNKAFSNPQKAQYTGYVEKDRTQEYAWYNKKYYTFKYAFDFGKKDSPVKENFLPVFEDSIYTPSTGYGWNNAGTRTGISRKQSKNVESKDITYKSSVNPLTIDFIEGKADDIFKVDLPDGKYVVCLIAGDKEDIPPIFEIFANDKNLGRISIPALYIFNTYEYPVEVKNNTLELHFKGEYGWLLNGLVIYPAEDKTLAQEEIKKLKYEIMLGTPEYTKQFTEYEYKEDNPPLPVNDKGYYIFPRNYMRYIYPNTIPAKDEIKNEISVFATQGEYIPASFGMYCQKNMDKVKVIKEDAHDAAGHKIDKESIGIKAVKCLYRPVISYYNPKKYLLLPSLLENFEDIDIPENKTQQFWITVKIPENTPAGEYTSILTLKPANAEAHKISLKIQVLPFKLDDPGIHIGMCYAYPMVNKARGRWNDQWQRMKKEFADMKEHGMNTVVPVCGWHGLSGWIVPGDKSFMTDTVLRTFVTAKETGMTYPINWHYLPADITGSTDSINWRGGGSNHIKKILSELTDKIKEQNLPELIFYPCDEPYTEERSKDAIAIGRAMKKELPDIKMSITFSDGTVNMLEKNPDLLNALIDTYDIIRIAPGKVTADFKAKIKSKGKSFCTYNNPVSWFTVPAKTRYSMGYLSWKWGIEGVILWHYQIFYYHGNPFNPIDNNKYGQCDVYPGENAPIPTIDWEVRREGINDYRYVKTLENAIKRAKDNNKKSDDVAKAEKLLKELSDKMKFELTTYNFYDKTTGAPLEDETTWNLNEYDNTRLRIAEMILTLAK